MDIIVIIARQSMQNYCAADDDLIVCSCGLPSSWDHNRSGRWSKFEGHHPVTHTHSQLTVCGSKINEHSTVCCCCCCWWSRHRISWVQNKFKMMLIDALDGLLTLSIRVFCVRNSEIHFCCCCCLYMRRTCKHAGNCWILMMNGRRTVCIVCPLSANQ